MATASTKDKTAEEFEADMAAIRKDLASLREDVAALANTAGRVALERKDRAAEAVREKATELAQRGEDLAAAVGREVQARPLAAVAIAFGIGYLIARMRRSR
jgi:ElaB/YqjD/DUF883 family membrane-anchored ribosome-binding protein